MHQGRRPPLRTKNGLRLPGLAWSWGKRDADRAEVRRLSGTSEVPILALDDGGLSQTEQNCTLDTREHPQANSTIASRLETVRETRHFSPRSARIAANHRALRPSGAALVVA